MACGIDIVGKMASNSYHIFDVLIIYIYRPIVDNENPVTVIVFCIRSY